MHNGVDFWGILLMCFMFVLQIFGMISNMIYRERMWLIIGNAFLAVAFLFLAFVLAVG